eukprot:2879811-Prymnesium_polylepis.1
MAVPAFATIAMMIAGGCPLATMSNTQVTDLISKPLHDLVVSRSSFTKLLVHQDRQFVLPFEPCAEQSLSGAVPLGGALALQTLVASRAALQGRRDFARPECIPSASTMQADPAGAMSR